MTYYSEDHGISYINSYISERHNGKFKCDHLSDKGRILLSNVRFEQGDVMFLEPPLHIVTEKPDNPWFDRLRKLVKRNDTFDYEPLWYWAAMNALCATQISAEARQYLTTITPDQQHRLLLLYHEKVEEPSSDAHAIIEHFGLTIDPLLMETLLQIWILNCFEHTDDPLGYATYFMSSFMSHSCLPCAVWHYEGDDFVLRARSRIEPGQEICCSYLSEDALLESTASRRSGLEESKHFVCTCERCTEPVDAQRGFRCIHCPQGTLFPSNDSVSGSNKPAPCRNCNHSLTIQEWKSLLTSEEMLARRVRDWEKRAKKLGAHRGLKESQVQAGLAALSPIFAHHWLVERLWAQASDFYDHMGSTSRAVELLRWRIELIEKSYSGLNGAHAWALEELGDMLNRNGDLYGAKESYDKALVTLRLMFGDDHEYTQDALTKQVAVMEKIQK